MSKSTEYILEASRKGYFVALDGRAIGPTGVVLKLTLKGNAPYTYCKFNLKGLKQVSVHRLQAYQKFGDKLFEPGVVVRHLNGNSLDNSFDNIALGSQSDNMFDIPEEVRLASALTAAKEQRKLSWDEMLQLRKDRDNGDTYKTLCSRYTISKSTVSYIVNNKTYNRN